MKRSILLMALALTVSSTVGFASDGLNEKEAKKEIKQLDFDSQLSIDVVIAEVDTVCFSFEESFDYGLSAGFGVVLKCKDLDSPNIGGQNRIYDSHVVHSVNNKFYTPIFKHFKKWVRNS